MAGCVVGGIACCGVGAGQGMLHVLMCWEQPPVCLSGLRAWLAAILLHRPHHPCPCCPLQAAWTT